MILPKAAKFGHLIAEKLHPNVENSDIRNFKFAMPLFRSYHNSLNHAKNNICAIAQIMVACKRSYSKFNIFDITIFDIRYAISRQSKVQILFFFARIRFAETDLWGRMPKKFCHL